LNSYCSYNDESNEDEEMANFIRNLKKGADKYKGKFFLKKFNCGKICHIVDKCPYDKKKENVEEEAPKKEKKYQKGDKRRNKKKFFKKNLYSKEESSSSNEDDDNKSDLENILYGL
jgi:hypothetical protein